MNTDNVYIAIINIILLLSCVTLSIAIINKKKLNLPLRIFMYYCIITLVISTTITHVIIKLNIYIKPIWNYLGITTTNTFDIFYFLRNFFLLGLFYSLLLAPRKIGTWIRYLGIGLAIACTINYLFIEGYKGFGVFNPTVDAIFCFVVPLIYCKVLFEQDDVIPLSKNPYFWITMGQLLVALVGFFLFFSEDYIIKSDPELFNKLAIGRNILMIIEQIMYAVAFYYAKNTRFLTPTH